MRICDLFSHTDQQIDEALGKWATLAALGVAGVAGLGALGGSGSSDTPDMSPI
jgi:hypothetical protein